MNKKEIYNGIIMAVHRDRYEVHMDSSEKEEREIEEFRESVFCRLKTGIYFKDSNAYVFPTVGDLVALEYNPIGDSMIIETKKRKTMFCRKDPDIGRGEQVVAANFDYVFIMMSLNYDFNIKRLERYLTASWESGGMPVVILTKADIADDLDDKLAMIYDIALGVNVHVVSSVTGEGMEEIKSYINGDSTIVFLGSSGVGKSTFTNYLLGDQIMKTNAIREEDSKGHHTTTYRQMFILENGTKIIDTPGMRELGMMDVHSGMEKTFVDIYALEKECKFSNCTHESEPGCAIQKGLTDGSLSRERWNNYLKIQKESRHQELKEQRKKAREEKGSGKKQTKYNRNTKYKSKML